MPKQPADSQRSSWTALFHQSTDAVFLLNPRRRLRYVNPAFEALAKVTAEQVVHEYCHPKKVQKDLPAGRRALLQSLSAPREVMEGRIVRVRRPAPPAKVGPPWWDISFTPIREGDKLLGVLGVIVPVGQAQSHAAGRGLSESVIALRQKVLERFPLPSDGNSLTFRRIHNQAELAAKSLSPLWINGQPGTGKQTLRAIHYHGVTRETAFAAIDCAGLQPYLIRSLLFGHNGLAETGRVGTIYLRSPDRLPADLQSELIEWAELIADQCRVVVANAGAAGLTPAFRAAFGIIEIDLPALSDRKDELQRLVAELLETETGSEKIAGISDAALAVLSNWPWPGNLRELRAVLRDALRHAGDIQIEPEHLTVALRHASVNATSSAAAIKLRPEPKLDDILEQVERRMIELALRKTKGDQTAAAELLGVYRSRLSRRVKALDLGE